MTRFLVGILALAFLTAPVSAQAIPANGTEILRALLKYHGFKPVDGRDRLQDNGTLVVIVGQMPNNRLLLEDRIPALLSNSSGVLVISDDGINVAGMFPREAAAGQLCGVLANAVNARNADTGFGGDRTMPYAQMLPTPVPELAPLSQLKQIATRNPSTIVRGANDSYLSMDLAKFPAGAVHRNGIPILPTSRLAVMSDPASLGTMMLFSNRAMFTNELMTAKDPNPQAGGMPGPQNFYLGYWVTSYFKTRVLPNIRGQGQQREVLFIEDGRVITDFDSVSFVERPAVPPGMPPIAPPLPLLLAYAFEKGNDIIAQAEEKDLPHAVLKNNETRARANVMIAFTVIGTILLCWYLLTRSYGAIRPTNVTPRPKIVLEGDGGMISQRRLGLIESGNLFEPLRDHTRYLFKQWGVPAAAQNLPPIKMDRPTRPTHRLLADVNTLWQIAFNRERQDVSLDDMEDLEDMIQDLTEAHGKGIWRFVSPEELESDLDAVPPARARATPRAKRTGGEA